MKKSRLRRESGEGRKGPQEVPDILNELLREKEVSLSLCGLRAQSQEVGESYRGENVELIIWKTSHNWNCLHFLEAGQIFLRDVEEKETDNVENKRMA